MSLATPFWGAPRIPGELLKLGINVSQTTIAKYRAKHRRPPSQGWRTFLLNHAAGIASIDLFVVPTSTFKKPVKTVGRVFALPVLGGLRHRYARI